MSELLPITIPKSESPVQIPAGERYIPLYEAPLPTNIQPGEDWSIDRIIAQIPVLLGETDAEVEQFINTETTVFKTKAEREAAETNRVTESRKISPLTFDGRLEFVTITNVYEHSELAITLNEHVKIERSIGPCQASLLIEVLDQQETIYSSTLQGTFRAIETHLYLCEFSTYIDLINKLVVGLGRLTLRISLFIGLGVQSEAELASDGFVNFFYDREVK